MKKLHYFIIFITLFLYPLNSCKKEIEPPLYSQTVSEIHQTIQKERPDILITEIEIERALQSETQTPICSWDFNFNGIIEGSDLLVFLSKFGVEYDSSDLLTFLSVFGEEYIVDIIPAWNNFIQDNTPNMNSFSVILCNGSLIKGNPTNSPTHDFDETFWLFDNNIVYVGPVLVQQLYDGNGEPSNIGWQAPCDGDKFITLRIVHNGKIFERTSVSRISAANSPVEACESLVNWNGPFPGFPAIPCPGDINFSGWYDFCENTDASFLPYEFCINCD